MTTTEPLTHPDLGRAWRELPGWRWMPGMLGLATDGRAFRIRDHGGRPEAMLERGPRLRAWAPPLDQLTPVATDHATVGCLHALAEEIVGGPVDLDWDEQWEAYSPERPGAFASGPTKAHALYALVLEVSCG